jgi:hypothetical protein
MVESAVEDLESSAVDDELDIGVKSNLGQRLDLLRSNLESASDVGGDASQ